MNLSINPATIIAQLAGNEINQLAHDQYKQKHEKDVQTLANDTKGAAKHYLRGKISFFVDILWVEADFQNALTPLCYVAAAAVLAENGISTG